MSSTVNKRMIVATCQHCGKATDISLSSEVARLRASHKTLKEELATAQKTSLNMRAQKNGQIQALNVTIKKLLNLMNSEQIKKATEEIKQLRGGKKENGNEKLKKQNINSNNT